MEWYVSVIRRSRAGGYKGTENEFKLIQNRMLNTQFQAIWAIHNQLSIPVGNLLVPERDTLSFGDQVLTSGEYQFFSHLFSIVHRDGRANKTEHVQQLQQSSDGSPMICRSCKTVVPEGIYVNLVTRHRRKKEDTLRCKHTKCRCSFLDNNMYFCEPCFLTESLLQLAPKFPTNLDNVVVKCPICSKDLCLFDVSIVTHFLPSSSSSSTLSTPMGSQEQIQTTTVVSTKRKFNTIEENDPVEEFLTDKTINSMRQIVEVGMRCNDKDRQRLWTDSIKRSRQIVDAKLPVTKDAPIENVATNEIYHQESAALSSNKELFTDFLIGSHMLMMERIEHKIFTDALKMAESLAENLRSAAQESKKKKCNKKQKTDNNNEGLASSILSSTLPPLEGNDDVNLLELAGMSSIEYEANSNLKPVLDNDAEKRKDSSLKEVYRNAVGKQLKKRDRSFTCEYCKKKDGHYKSTCSMNPANNGDLKAKKLAAKKAEKRRLKEEADDKAMMLIAIKEEAIAKN